MQPALRNDMNPQSLLDCLRKAFGALHPAICLRNIEACLLSLRCRRQTLKRSTPFIAVAALLVVYGVLRATHVFRTSGLTHTLDIVALCIGLAMFMVATCIVRPHLQNKLMSDDNRVLRYAAAGRANAANERAAATAAAAQRKRSVAWDKATAIGNKLATMWTKVAGAWGKKAAAKHSAEEPAQERLVAVQEPEQERLVSVEERQPVRLVDLARVDPGAPRRVSVPARVGVPVWRNDDVQL